MTADWHRTIRLVSLFLMVASTGSAARADDWPQWRGPNRDGVWNEKGIISTFDGPVLKPVWRAKIASGYSGPTVADGRVYVSDRLTEPKQVERVHCFDAKTGHRLWSHTYDRVYRGIQYEAGPRASISLAGGRAFALGSMGDLHCLDAADGRVLWHHDLNAEYSIRMPIWGITASPLVDEGRVIVQVGGEDACLVAFDTQSGKEVWRALKDRASYAAPIIIEQAKRRVLVCWTGDNVVGLDPKTGDVYWKYGFKPKQVVLAIATPAYDAGRLFVSGFYDGSLLLELNPDKLAVRKLWRRMGPSERETDALHSIISTPMLIGDYIYGVDSYGELRCLEAATGDRVWEDLTATPKARWSTIHFVRNHEHIWMFNERGELIISKLSPKGFEEISRAKLLDPTTDQLRRRGGVCWSHPAFANRHVFARNDKELVCADLGAVRGR